MSLPSCASVWAAKPWAVERVGDGAECGAHRPVALRRVHPCRQALAVLESHLVREELGLVGAERVERSGEESGQEVVVLERECERGVERASLVALGRSPGSPGRTYVRRLGCGHREVSPAGQLLEMVARDVGMQAESLGDLAGGGTRLAGLPYEQVDLPPRGIAERVGDRTDHRVELVGGETGLGEGLGHARYSTYLGSANPSDLDRSGVAGGSKRRESAQGSHVPGEDATIRTALEAVEDPELRRSIVELGMVQGVALDGGNAVIALGVRAPG